MLQGKFELVGWEMSTTDDEGKDVPVLGYNWHTGTTLSLSRLQNVNQNDTEMVKTHSFHGPQSV